MGTRRVGDRELEPNAEKRSGGSSRLARVSAAIATPLGVLTILPLLVAAVGLFLTIVGQRALRNSNLTMADDRINEGASLVASGIRGALAQSDPILDRLGALAREHDPTKPYVAVAHSLRDLMQGRPGVSYVSISFPDGTFEDAYQYGPGEEIHFQDSRVSPSGTLAKRYSFVGHGALALDREEHNDYDPRTRPFYALAVASKGRVWTKPYPFFKTRSTGITRTEALWLNAARGNPLLHAVITVDFDVDALSAALRNVGGAATTFLCAGDGTLLAYPNGAAIIDRLPLQSDRALVYRDLNDPLLAAFFAKFSCALPNAASSSALPSSRLEVNGSRLLVAVQPVTAGLTGGGLAWSVAALTPEARVLEPLHVHERRSLLAAGVATLLATAISWLFARHILRTRHEIAEARAATAKAVARAQELGSYRLVERLGKGGMGEVWRAEHRLLVRQAAIKLVRIEADSALGEREVQERFRREAQSLATLRSRNTIELFDYGVTAQGTFFYVMELLDGMDLETLVEKYGPQPAGRVIHFLIQACNSLAEAHDAGLVHRDIKPANLYVCRVADEVDVLKVLDFGLVRAALRGENQQPGAPPTSGTIPAASANVNVNAIAIAIANELGDARLTQMGQAMGTPAYMAPEQALGHEADGRADLYALGCVAFWLLTGKLLFERSGSLPMMMAHITEPAPALEPLVSGFLPTELATQIRFCLAKQPADRPRDARALARALKAIPIPLAEQWTEAHAQTWWREHRSKAANNNEIVKSGVA